MKKFLVILLLIPRLVYSQAAFDTTFEKGQTATGNTFSFVSNAGTTSGTVGGTNRTLIACLAFDAIQSAVDPVTVTWDSVSMTQIVAVNDANNKGSTYIFGLINPNTGNKTLAAAITGVHIGRTWYMGAINVKDTNQTTAWQNSGSDTGTSTAPSSVVTTVSGNFATVCHDNDNASTTVINVGTSAWIDTCCNTNAAQGYVASSGTSATVSWTLGASKDWGNTKLDVCQLAGCSGGGGGSTNTSYLITLGVGKYYETRCGSFRNYFNRFIFGDGSCSR